MAQLTSVQPGSTPPAPHLKEFEWFEIDSKIRILVLQLVEPYIKDMSEQRIKHEMLAQRLDKYTENFEEFRQMHYQQGKGQSIFQALQAQMQEIRLKQDDLTTNTQFQLLDLKRNFDTLRFIKDQLAQDLHSLQAKVENNDALLNRSFQQAAEYKEAFAQNIEALKSDHKQDYIKLQKSLQELKASIESQDLLVKDQKIRTTHTQERYNILQEHLLQNQQKLAQLVTQFEHFKSQLSVLEGVNNSLTRFKNSQELMQCKLINFENYIEKYQPLYIQGCISDTLHNCLQQEDKYRLAQFEESRFTELHKIILEDDGKPNLEQRMNQFGYLVEKAQKRNMQLMREQKPLAVVHIPDDVSSKISQSKGSSSSSDSSARVGPKGEDFRLDRQEMEAFLSLKFGEFEQIAQSRVREVHEAVKSSDKQLEYLQESMISMFQQVRNEVQDQLKLLTEETQTNRQSSSELQRCLSELSEVQLQHQKIFQKLLHYSIIQSQLSQSISEISFNGQQYTPTQANDLAARMLQQMRFELSSKTPKLQTLTTDDEEHKKSVRMRTSSSYTKKSHGNSNKQMSNLYLLGSQIQGELTKSVTGERRANIKLLYQKEARKQYF